MKKILITVMTIVMCAGGSTHAESEQPQDNPYGQAAIQQAMNSLQVLAPLLVEAINKGESHATLGGPISDYMKRSNMSSEPLRVNVTTIKKFKQPGCSRLNIQFLQDNVTVPGETKPRNREIDYQLNYCVDGRPPKDEGKEYILQSQQQFQPKKDVKAKP